MYLGLAAPSINSRFTTGVRAYAVRLASERTLSEKTTCLEERKITGTAIVKLLDEATQPAFAAMIRAERPFSPVWSATQSLILQCWEHAPSARGRTAEQQSLIDAAVRFSRWFAGYQFPDCDMETQRSVALRVDQLARRVQLEHLLTAKTLKIQSAQIKGELVELAQEVFVHWDPAKFKAARSELLKLAPKPYFGPWREWFKLQGSIWKKWTRAERNTVTTRMEELTAKLGQAQNRAARVELLQHAQSEEGGLRIALQLANARFGHEGTKYTPYSSDSALHGPLNALGRVRLTHPSASSSLSCSFGFSSSACLTETSPSPRLALKTLRAIREACGHAGLPENSTVKTVFAQLEQNAARFMVQSWPEEVNERLAEVYTDLAYVLRKSPAVQAPKDQDNLLGMLSRSTFFLEDEHCHVLNTRTRKETIGKLLALCSEIKMAAIDGMSIPDYPDLITYYVHLMEFRTRDSEFRKLVDPADMDAKLAMVRAERACCPVWAATQGLIIDCTNLERDVHKRSPEQKDLISEVIAFADWLNGFGWGDAQFDYQQRVANRVDQLRSQFQGSILQRKRLLKSLRNDQEFEAMVHKVYLHWVLRKVATSYRKYAAACEKLKKAVPNNYKGLQWLDRAASIWRQWTKIERDKVTESITALTAQVRAAPTRKEKRTILRHFL
ncbi:hypothetical protein JCM10908_003636 [Rhodotorula pacifica]|uniref:uncharacterized protein n=1 Tax=Rhodotorula pacifica TaxID=1495444 RepID=UPI0031803362